MALPNGERPTTAPADCELQGTDLGQIDPVAIAKQTPHDEIST